MSFPRYERKSEGIAERPSLSRDNLIPMCDVEAALAESDVTAGTQDLVRGLVRLARPAIFAGGGLGIEYGSLLKTAVDPVWLRRHIEEAAGHLRERHVDVLMVPGMSGYPIGSMYAFCAAIPAILLKKQRVLHLDESAYPVGTFVIPSYTGDGDVVMSADQIAVQDVVDRVFAPQMTAQQHLDRVELQLRIAGADDIIDKATMSQAVSESGMIAGTAAATAFIERWRSQTGDVRTIDLDIRVVAWVTPLIKGYNRPHAHLERLFGVTPFAGLTIDHLQIDPPAIGIQGVGVIAFD